MNLWQTVSLLYDLSIRCTKARVRNKIKNKSWVFVFRTLFSRAKESGFYSYSCMTTPEQGVNVMSKGFMNWKKMRDKKWGASWQELTGPEPGQRQANQ